METSGINNYSAYTSYDVGVKPKDKAEVDKTSAEKTQSKTYGSTRDYKKYLTEKYDCLRSKEYDVKRTHYENLAKRYDYFKHLSTKLSELNKASLTLSNNHQGYWWSDIQMEDSYEI